MVQEALERRSRHSSEIDDLRRDVLLKEKLLKRFTDEIERCKIEHRAMPRVSIADEPYVRP